MKFLRYSLFFSLLFSGCFRGPTGPEGPAGSAGSPGPVGPAGPAGTSAPTEEPVEEKAPVEVNAGDDQTGNPDGSVTLKAAVTINDGS